MRIRIFVLAGALFALGSIEHPEILPRRASSTTPAPDFSGRSSLELWPDLTAASGTRANQGAAGSDCDLGVSAGDTILSGTTSDGWTGADFEADDNEWLFATDASCDEVDTAGDVTVIIGFEMESTGQNKRLFFNIASSEGYYCQVRDSSSDIACWFGDGATTAANSANNITTTGVPYGVAGTYDDTAGEVRVWLGGSGSGWSSASGGANLSEGASDVSVSQSDASNDMDGIVFHVSVWREEVPDDRVPWVLSCLPDGSLCSCNGASYADTGRYDDFGFVDTLPDCNDATF